MLQKELNSYVLRFYANESNLSCSKSGWCWLRIVVAESREKFYLLQQSLYILRVLPAPRQTCKKEHNSHIWGDSCVYYPFRSQYSYHANCSNPICFKTGLTVGGKTRNIAFQLVLLQYCKTSCTFCCLFYHSFNKSLYLFYICCSLRTHHEGTPG